MAVRVFPPMLSATVEPATLVPVMVLATSEALITSSVATTLITGAMGASVSTLMAAVPICLLVRGFRAAWRGVGADNAGATS